MANTKPARGMRDFLPADIRKRNYVIGIIKEVYESYGFEPLETPAVENIETLTGKYGEEGNQLIFKILKRGQKLSEVTELTESAESANSEGLKLSNSETSLSDLALRYDLTVPLARVVANNKNDLPKFFKRYQVQPVWRADRPARGRFREFYQCDVDAIGSNSMVVEAELISAVSEILIELGFKDFAIRLNHRGILSGMCEAAKIQKKDYENVLGAVDKIDKIGNDGVEKELVDLGLTKQSLESIMKLLRTLRFQRTTLGKMDNIGIVKHPIDNLLFNRETLQVIKENFEQADVNRELEFQSLNAVLDFTDHLQCSNRVHFDISIARGLSYYTGTIMEIVLNDGDFNGSIGGGGRYDGLIGMFGKEQIPACGFSLGLERILVVMDERNMFPPEIAASNSADVMVTIWNGESIGESLKLANELRQQGLRVVVYPEADKIAKQFKYAAQINVPYVCVLGESELAGNKVTLKNMETGEQETLGRDSIASRIKS